MFAHNQLIYNVHLISRGATSKHGPHKWITNFSLAGSYEQSYPQPCQSRVPSQKALKTRNPCRLSRSL